MTHTLSIAELAAASGASARVIEQYLSDGLLPALGGGSSDGQLQRLRLIGLLQDERMPMNAIRAAMAAMTDVEVARTLVTKQPLARTQVSKAYVPRPGNP